MIATIKFQIVERSPFIFFFFQAEDGIRDSRVTGVQTCALPIFMTGEHRGLPLHELPFPLPCHLEHFPTQIGRASCRERV